jgi:hypothetical protein
MHNMKRAPFAPGTVERHRRPFATPAQRRELRRWLKISTAMVVLAGTVGFLLGLARGFA